MIKSKKKNKGKKVVVTGGAGFLGSHLSRELVERGYEVHIVDNMVGAMKGRELHPKATLHKIDVRDSKKLNALFKKLGPITGVFHLAALPRVQFSIDNPEESHDVNINGTLNVLLVSKNHKVGKVVYSASSSAYGDQATLPLHEGMIPNPKSPYALQKYLGEHYCRIFHLVYGLPTVSLRYFNIYGPGADPNGPYAQAIIKFIHLRKQGKPITVTGDGKQTRDSVHVHDVVRANISALESKKVGKGEVINIGSGRNASVNNIAKLVGGEVVHIAPRIEPRHTKADIRRARELLKWEPTVSIEEGIAELKQLLGVV